MPGRLPMLASVDARRPAVWLTLVAATVVAALLADAPSGVRVAPAVMAAAVGSLLAVAAVGDMAPPLGAGGIDSSRLVERAMWPLLGWLIAAAGLGGASLAASGALGIVAGAGLFALLTRRGLLAADAASATLVAAASAGALGWWVDDVWPEQMPGGVVAGGLLAGVVVAAWMSLGWRRRNGGSSLRATARHLLTAAAMNGAMAGMVGWMFLTADLAMLDLAASLAWFVALAVPAATLGDGVSHAVVWRRLERVAPRRAGWPPRLAPGRIRDSVHATVTSAALLGWPPLVVAALAGGDVARSGAALLVVAALVAAAVALLLIVGLGGLVRATPDTQLAVALAGTCLCMAAVATLGPRQAPDLLVRLVGGW